MKVKPLTTRESVPLNVNPVAEPRIAASLFRRMQELPAVKFKKVLATTDFSELSMEGVEYAISLAEEIGATVSLVNVVQPFVSLDGMESVVIARGDDEIIKLEKKRLARLAKKLGKTGRPVTSVSRYGKAFREIAALAKEQKFDLIVTATHGYTGLKSALIGSTSEWVVRHAPCPVLTVPAQIVDRKSGRRWTSGIRKILVPIDFSDTSTEALPYATTLARTFKAEVTLIHVTEPLPTGGEFGYAPFLEMEAQAKQSAEELLLRVQREAFGEEIYTDAVVRAGTPYHEITNAAKRLDADLIILTTHGYTGLKHVLLGSTAERIVRHANCPVLVIRDASKQ